MVILRRLCTGILCAQAYGLAIGGVHGPEQAALNLVKFPLLIVLTALLCAVAYHVSARFLTDRLPLRAMCELALDTYTDTSVLLAALAPVALFLARTIEAPDEAGLHEYPLFLGLNVAFIAAAGSLSLSRRALELRGVHGLSPRRTLALLTAWLALSLFAGGQVCWTFRPYFGVRTIALERPFDGARPDFRGATSFYEAVWNLFDPPPPPDGDSHPR